MSDLPNNRDQVPYKGLIKNNQLTLFFWELFRCYLVSIRSSKTQHDSRQCKKLFKQKMQDEEASKRLV